MASNVRADAICSEAIARCITTQLRDTLRVGISRLQPRRSYADATAATELNLFHARADGVLGALGELIEDTLDNLSTEEMAGTKVGNDFDVAFEDGVLTVAMAPSLVWVLNKQTPNRQVWWSSPISGPLRFEFDEQKARWVSLRDGVELVALLVDEFSTALNVHIDAAQVDELHNLE